ncbi:MAG TPA: hypothetical protein VFN42_02900 [Acetobacteraceae bacterium]|nr:hypothetical protein [Acetobacteraceae bacterium]
MTAHPPPVPPEQRPRHGVDPQAPQGEATAHPESDPRNLNTAEQSRQGNTKQNTTNKGYQQDR